VTTTVKTLSGGMPPSKPERQKAGEQMPDLYPIMRGKAYRLAETIIAPKYQGEDLPKTIMLDSDDHRISPPLF
jgi:hypothetical protein